MQAASLINTNQLGWARAVLEAFGVRSPDLEIAEELAERARRGEAYSP